ncbi:Hsp20/alpha crystallin family protein [Methylacidimicrobium sp. B4]|uniref:Hsp20/alpha crystallin family protein n=1 Tax=Methylacidimicrobium sp. B4 TaxID=2796139 RepID=UPI001A8E7F7C|nr:Hsp20/alpha crystallin family protein [Methylacidimicrobium sp. B4]QSR84965.1 Hsp20/alpha crystallin family protein [Methylacidimicrobium sp. B4]
MNGLVRRGPAGLGVWDPFRELEEMRKRMASLWDRPLELLEAPSERLELAEWRPLADITEDDKEYLVKLELPGMKREEVRVSMESGVLTISGERKLEKEEKNKKYHRVERAYGSFSRSFVIPDDVVAEKIDAQFKEGVLQVHLPKGEHAKPKTIEVKG